MEKTNFTFLRSISWVMAFAMLFVVSTAANASLTCNDNVQVSVDPALNLCQVEVNADMILENPDPAETYEITISNGPNVLWTGTNSVVFDASAWLGATLTVNIEEQSTTNSCWGSITIEDKAKPVIDCPTAPINITCTDDLSIVPFPTADDNCDVNPVVELTDMIWTDLDACDNGQVVVERYFVATDASGNVSDICVQIITINRPDDIDFPDDITWDCALYAANPGIIDASLTGSGIPQAASFFNGATGTPYYIDEQYCQYAYSHADDVLPTCNYPASTDSPVFKIIRTWTVLDWCTGNVVTSNNGGEDNVQVIKVADTTPPAVGSPTVEVQANVPGAHPQPCTSTGYIPAPTVSDDCTDIVYRQ